jgi:hypothetical protein
MTCVVREVRRTFNALQTAASRGPESAARMRAAPRSIEAQFLYFAPGHR